ncbi:MAG: DNA translocase FtsK [Candidatus Aureabacteria bacterium]|nr:DNA translocase FtsK [Candidatus Auribacterota bacterium]
MEKEQERRKQEKRREAEAVRRKRPASAPAVAVSSVSSAVPGGAYRLPSLDLLITPPPLTEREIKDDIEVNSKILESTLQDFGIEAKVVGAERGPAITRYELQPAPGVKVSKIKTLDNDIALAMKAVSIRILAPIPGKAAIGIEVPNSSTALVYVREMLESPEFQNGHARLPLALGKDISGTPIVADLTDMPHLLIAGATGSGKTVCMNSVIVSLLFARTPDELQMILVDPKKVEMAAYARLPHLICPVVTDTVKTSLALAWLVKEMERRYDLFARVGARNIEGYNRAPKERPAGEGEEELPAAIPYILLMIDEMADLMLQAQTEIENQIARLAHLSRAVGIHMILATQRPSVDVITGVIKANFPARLSFKVAAKVDSRTVLDTSGADKLLGNGDLLFLPPATSRLIRAQGTLCQDSEIEAVVGFVNRQREPRFRAEIFQRAANAAGIALGGGEDILLEAAIEVIKQTGRASVSVLQRKLKIGYSRSSRIVDILEEKGIVGPYQGSKERDVLIDTYAGSAPADEEKEEE